MKTAASSVMKRKKDESKIDLTPMLDVVFILLIFFVVTSSFLKESALDIEGQEPNNNPPPPTDDKQNVLIQISSSNTIFLNNERIDMSAVRARVAQLRAENPEAAVIVKPAPSSKANALVEVMDSAREAGATTIQVIE